MNIDIKILLVEDDATCAALVRRMLEAVPGANVSIEHVATLASAITHIRQIEFDAVLLDLGLPDSNAPDTIDQLRKADPNMAIVVLTGNDDEEIAIHAIRSGAQDYVAKDDLDAKHVLRAIRYAMARQERVVSYKAEARTDSLTGTVNRRSFDHDCQQEISRAGRYGRALSCALLDIDFFKTINDTYGHAVGDTALQAVAGVLRKGSRENDLICRYGGDEFCILLAETSEADAASWAERVRVEIGELAIPAGQKTIRLTSTLGVVEWRQNVQTPQELVDLADQALLAAKHSGRNRVQRYSEVSDLGDTDNLATGEFIQRLAHVPASQVMQSPVACLNQRQSLRQAAEFFLRMRINSAPVVDDEEKLVGVISEKDLLKTNLSHASWHAPIKDVMTVNVVSYEEHVPVVNILKFLSRVTIRRLVIVDDKRVPIGVISRGSLLRWLGNWEQMLRPGAAACDGQEGTLSPTEGFRQTASAIMRECEQLQRGLEADPEDEVPLVLHTATRIQEHAQDLLALSQIKHKREPGLVIGALQVVEPHA